MKRLLAVAVLGIMILAGISYAREVTTTDLTNSAGATNITVAGSNTVYTTSFPLDNSEYNTISYYAYSASGSINLVFQLQQSWVKPTTEGAADGNWTTGVDVYDIASGVTTESTWYNKAVSAPALKYGRVKIYGQGANNADTIVNLKLHTMDYYNK